MKSLPWHHVHITLPDREEAAKWHEKHTPAIRTQPTKRSENLYCGSNLLQIQSRAVATESQDGYIDSIGIGVLKVSEATANWQSAGGSIDNLSPHTAKVRDPWGISIEFIESNQKGYTHINIAAEEPEKLSDWYESNLGGTRITCEWDESRLVLLYDTMKVMFIIKSPISSTGERIIDHLGWYTEDLDTTFHQLSTNSVHFPVLPREFGPVRLAFAEDPCGNWIELLEPPNGIIMKPIWHKYNKKFKA